MPRTLDRIAQRAMPFHQFDGPLDVAVLLLQPFHGAAPELAFRFRSAPPGEHHRQADLALAEIVADGLAERSEEHTSELQSLMRISYADFRLKKKNKNTY